MNPCPNTRRTLFTGLLLACGAQASAAFVAPTTWTRGAGGTTYQHWDVFTDDNGVLPLIVDNTPDLPGFTNPNGTPTVTENTGTSFITGGGNIYSFGGTTQFTVTVPEADVPAPAHNVTAIVQFRTQGTELNDANIKLNGLSAVDSAELSRTPLGGFGGTLVDSWFLFRIPYLSFGNGDGVSDLLTLTFQASGSSMSLDQLSIDTAIRPFGYYNEPNPVPEPASLLLAFASAPLLLRRRCRAF